MDTIKFSYTYSKLSSSSKKCKQTESTKLSPTPESTKLLARVNHYKGDSQLFSFTAGKETCSVEQLELVVWSDLHTEAFEPAHKWVSELWENSASL